MEDSLDDKPGLVAGFQFLAGNLFSALQGFNSLAPLASILCVTLFSNKNSVTLIDWTWLLHSVLILHLNDPVEELHVVVGGGPRIQYGPVAQHMPLI